MNKPIHVKLGCNSDMVAVTIAAMKDEQEKQAAFQAWLNERGYVPQRYIAEG